MNEINRINFAKITLTLIITFISTVTIAIGYMVFGYILGGILHQSTHEHNYYSCKCDSPTILTETEALIFGVIFIVVYFIALNAILRLLKFSKTTHIIALILMLIANICAVYMGINLLTTQVSG